MNKKELIDKWLHEERIAHIRGWDFSHIEGRFEAEGDLPWDYREIVERYIKPEDYLLDIDTGGGEFLLSLKHPYNRTGATENFAPNVLLCRETLLPLGIDFRHADGNGVLPFENDKFDVIINRHGAYNAGEIYRVLKPGGVFITEQVGAENDRDLVEMLLTDVPELPFPEQYLSVATDKFEAGGFSIVDAQEVYRPIRFFDVGALVWFARIIEWEFPGFSVEESLEKLFCLQELLEQKGVIEGRIHRFLLVAKKE